MSEFVKKTMVGYKTVPGGHSDPECTHAILTLKEYDQILQEKRQEEKETGFRAGSKRLHKVMLWETTIQTPYSVQMAEAVVRKQIEEDLFPAGKKAMIVGRIGITGKFNGSYEKFLEGKEQNPENSFYDGNVVIARQQRLKRRFRMEYWEVAIVHTKPLGDVPEDLLPFEKKPVQGA